MTTAPSGVPSTFNSTHNFKFLALLSSLSTDNCESSVLSGTALWRLSVAHVLYSSQGQERESPNTSVDLGFGSKQPGKL